MPNHFSRNFLVNLILTIDVIISYNYTESQRKRCVKVILLDNQYMECKFFRCWEKKIYYPSGIFTFCESCSILNLFRISCFKLCIFRFVRISWDLIFGHYLSPSGIRETQNPIVILESTRVSKISFHLVNQETI
jgi:hypothetical protein